jgi:hypothetical protein
MVLVCFDPFEGKYTIIDKVNILRLIKLIY